MEEELEEYRPSEEERNLRDLVALIHRDGGEHTTKVGLFQSAKDARKKIEAIQKAVINDE